MRDYERPNHPIVTCPIWAIDPEYKEAALRGYPQLNKPLSECTDDDWDNLLAE